MGCICPKCKSNNVIPIMYGCPAPEAMEEAEKGNLKLGGCEVFIGGGHTRRMTLLLGWQKIYLFLVMK